MLQRLGMQRETLLSIIVASLLLSPVIASCYFPNGTDRNIGLSSELYQACDGGGKHSMCCQRNHDRCRSDGLCVNSQNNEIWRESCTDPTWRSPACVRLCVMGIGTPCGDRSLLINDPVEQQG